MKKYLVIGKRSSALLAAVVLAACQPADDSDSSATESPQQLRAESEAYAGVGASELMADDTAMRLGERLFAAHCASCHGANGRGNRGSVDLSAGHFNYGTTPEAVRATIREGRQSTMPAMGRNLGEVDLGQLVAYVQSLSTEAAPATTYQKRGSALFAEHCASCHGADGHGSVEKGAPDLADAYWRNGSSMMNIRLAITAGVQAQCPARADTLSDPETNLLAAFVLKLIDSARTPG